MRLLIISHTEHYKTTDGTIVGWGPTINEINHLAPHFTAITHLAMLHSGKAPKSSSPYTVDNINFKALPALGGTSIWSKLKLMLYFPKVVYLVSKALRDVDAFQLRVPTGIGVYLIPFLTLFTKKKGWFKYAGNWNQHKPPLGYRIQRLLLKHQRRTVTINGNWPNQPKHCLTFENPCLEDIDLKNGTSILKTKELEQNINFCFVGRLETPKGVGRIIEAFNNLPEDQKNRVGDIHLIGDGSEKESFQTSANQSSINFIFHGFLGRNEVFNIYRKSHFFLLPTTASEGFPKVIAEAANFGCVPIVSSVSSIEQYIKHNQNGLILSSPDSIGLKSQLESIFEMKNDDYKKLAHRSQDLVKCFTFSYYNNRILKEILVDSIN